LEYKNVGVISHGLAFENPLILRLYRNPEIAFALVCPDDSH